VEDEELSEIAIESSHTVDGSSCGRPCHPGRGFGAIYLRSGSERPVPLPPLPP
jgi:hypothetical protein